ncbi:hypothetical protein [Flavobacterium anhuiense]|uniref:hypothetical protein n=1 Tax=Flavobacterium anhuiense TaxID=459526 RepID=UPI0034D98234
MKASIIINSVKPFGIQSDPDPEHAAFRAEADNLEGLADLYRKNDDEPDFDCEFLYPEHHDFAEEHNIIDPGSEDELLDEFNDSQWDADIYNPYLEPECCQINS